MVSGYKNANEIVNEILDDFFERNINNGNKPGLFKKLRTNLDKLMVIKFHVGQFGAVDFDANVVTTITVAYRDLTFEMQAFMSVNLLGNRYLINLNIYVDNTDSYTVTASSFSPMA